MTEGGERGSEELLRVTDLSVSFPSSDGPVSRLSSLNLSLGRGQTLGLIGRSGSGKTTASKAILGLLPRNATVRGRVEFEGSNLLDLPERDRRAIRWEKLALVPQAAMNSLDPVIRIDKQIAEVIRAHRKIDRVTALEMAREALVRVGINANRANAFPHQFSGGMRQRALIAMATVLDPTVLVADEPTTGLDVIVQDRILELLVQAKNDFGLSLLLVTHDLGVATELCDELIVLEEGRTTARGTPAHVFRSHDDLVGPRQGPDADPTSDRSEAGRALSVDHLEVFHKSGRGLEALRKSSELKVLDDVSLTIDRGEVLGLAGESGCGKSSLIASLLGLIRTRAGTISVNGSGPARSEDMDWRELRRDVQMIFQDPYDSLNPRLSVRRTVGEPLTANRSHLGHDEDDHERRIVAALQAAQLDPSVYLDRFPDELSGGERQRIAIARALVLEPSVLLADEPVSMLDETTAAEIVTLLHDLTHRLNVAVLLVSHDLSLLRRICNRVAIMYMGQIVEIGPTDEVLERPQHPYTRALIQAVPSRDPAERRTRVHLPGEPPSLADRPPACTFHPRCPRATDICSDVQPVLLGNGHKTACWHPHEQMDPEPPIAHPADCLQDERPILTRTSCPRPCGQDE